MRAVSASFHCHPWYNLISRVQAKIQERLGRFEKKTQRIQEKQVLCHKVFENFRQKWRHSEVAIQDG